MDVNEGSRFECLRIFTFIRVYSRLILPSVFCVDLYPNFTPAPDSSPSSGNASPSVLAARLGPRPPAGTSLVGLPSRTASQLGEGIQLDLSAPVVLNGRIPAKAGFDRYVLTV